MTRDAFLEQFFGDGNIIRLQQVAESQPLQDLVEDLTEDLSRPAVLPRRLATGGEVHWFVLCGNDTTLRAVRDDLQGFIGPTYGRWDGLRATLDDADAVESAVLAFAQGRALRFRTESDAEFADCWKALNLMRGVWRQRPTQSSVRIRTGAAVINDFELALAAGNTEVAVEQVDELRRRGLVSAENLRFLEIRLLAGQGQWSDIANAPDLRDLAGIRRPWLVTEDILTALYRAQVASAESASDVDVALERVEALAQEVPEFFSTRGPLRSSDVVKLFALRNALPDRQDRVHIEAALALPAITQSDRAWIEAVLASVSTPTPTQADAREALAAGDLDLAYSLAIAAPDSSSRAEILVECAFELGTLDSAREAISALDALSEDELAPLLERRLLALAIESVRGLGTPATDGSEAIPATWREWLRRLLEDPGWTSAEAVAVCGELEYDSADVVDPVTAEQLASLILDAADSDRRQTFRDALPHIVRWLERSEADPITTRPVHVAILTVLALDDAWGEASLEVAYSATESLVDAGLDEHGYAELLAQLSLFWTRMAAVSQVAWLADVLELLELHSGPRDQLLAFAAASIGPILSFVDRVDVAVVDGLARSAMALGATDLASAVQARVEHHIDGEQTVPEDALAGQLVGIYTLTPQVGIRAREAIERRFPGVNVQVDSSHVSTPSLEQLARTADYLLVSIRSAKHAATDSIERHRPRDRPTLKPRGRGSTRIVDALIAAISQQAS